MVSFTIALRRSRSFAYVCQPLVVMTATLRAALLVERQIKLILIIKIDFRISVQAGGGGMWKSDFLLRKLDV